MYHVHNKVSAISSTAWFTWDAAECRMEAEGTIFFSQVGLACQAYATFHWQASCLYIPGDFLNKYYRPCTVVHALLRVELEKSVLVI